MLRWNPASLAIVYRAPYIPIIGRKSRVARFGLGRDTIVSVGQKILPAFDRLIMRSAATPEHQVFPNETFSWIPYLESQTPVIRREAEMILRDRMSVPSVREISPDHAKI